MHPWRHANEGHALTWTNRNSSYMPPSRFGTARSRCARTLQWSMGVGAVTRALEHLQAQRCRREDALLLDTTGLALGGQINLASLALSSAALTGRPMVLHGRWRYSEGPACTEALAGEGGRECFFRAKVGCGEGVVAAQRGRIRMRAHKDGGDVLEHTDTHIVRNGLAQRGLLRAHGLFWWTAQLQGFLTAPSWHMQARKRSAQQSLGLEIVAQETGVIGLHVRHGDACVHAAQSNTRPLCRRFEEYLPALAQMRDRYAVRTVFVSTDDAAVAQAAPAALAALGMRAVSLELDRSVFASSWFIEHRVEAAALDGSGLAESMLLDLLLLADCDFLVGTLSSQMSRLALALMTLRLGGVRSRSRDPGTLRHRVIFQR